MRRKKPVGPAPDVQERIGFVRVDLVPTGPGFTSGVGPQGVGGEVEPLAIAQTVAVDSKGRTDHAGSTGILDATAMTWASRQIDLRRMRQEMEE